MIKIVIVDDHSLFRDGIKFALAHSKEFEVTGEAANGKEFLLLLEKSVPDIVLMDIAMPEMDGIEAVEKALLVQPNLSIVAISMFSDISYYHKMVSKGVKGFLLKEANLEELKNCIREVANGRTYFSQELLQSIIVNLSNPKVSTPSKKVIELTRREEEVLKLICKGYDNKEISDALFISTKTVEGHKTNLMTKTNTKNAINLLLFAFKHKLVDLDLPN